MVQASSSFHVVVVVDEKKTPRQRTNCITDRARTPLSWHVVEISSSDGRHNIIEIDRSIGLCAKEEEEGEKRPHHFTIKIDCEQFAEEKSDDGAAVSIKNLFISDRRRKSKTRLSAVVFSSCRWIAEEEESRTVLLEAVTERSNANDWAARHTTEDNKKKRERERRCTADFHRVRQWDLFNHCSVPTDLIRRRKGRMGKFLGWIIRRRSRKKQKFSHFTIFSSSSSSICDHRWAISKLFNKSNRLF